MTVSSASAANPAEATSLPALRSIGFSRLTPGDSVSPLVALTIDGSIITAWSVPMRTTVSISADGWMSLAEMEELFWDSITANANDEVAMEVTVRPICRAFTLATRLSEKHLATILSRANALNKKFDDDEIAPDGTAYNDLLDLINEPLRLSL